MLGLLSFVLANRNRRLTARTDEHLYGRVAKVNAAERKSVGVVAKPFGGSSPSSPTSGGREQMTADLSVERQANSGGMCGLFGESSNRTYSDVAKW